MELKAKMNNILAVVEPRTPELNEYLQLNVSHI